MLDFGYYNADCVQGMKQFPDKFFDLAIVDPPYGIGYDASVSSQGGQQYGRAAAPKRTYHTANWDDQRPTEEYFNELLRVSKNQIIWGGNYFADMLPPSRGFIVWDKRLDESMSNSFADCEYAWCSPDLGVARMFRFVWNGMLQGNMKNKEERIHPTQKPIALYRWILSNYAKEGDKILDTHVGSASSLIACEDCGYKYVGFEIDRAYYDKGVERIKLHKAQISITELLNDWRLP